jgi:chromate transporter
VTDSKPSSRRAELGELASLFLRLGTTAFGGPAVHIAMMEDEVVRRRRWLSRDAFLDLVGATNLIPGPNSTELAIHIGRARAGWPGLLVAGAAFILPAALIVVTLAWAYVRYGALPQASGMLYGIKPVIIAVVVQALWGLGRSAVKSRLLALVALASLTAAAAGAHELLVLAVAGALCGLLAAVSVRPASGAVASGVLLAAPGSAPSLASPALLSAAATAAPASFGLWPLFGVFLKIGAVLFGSGYVLLAFLRADLVGRLGWLTERQLLDAVAVGQVTPGPVFTTATFIGYLLGGPAGAVAATAGIFLPAFVFVALSGPLIPRLRRSRAASGVLDGVNVASLALMAVVAWQLSHAAVLDLPTALLAVGSAVLLLVFRVNSMWLVLGGAVIGVVAAQWR